MEPTWNVTEAMKRISSKNVYGKGFNFLVFCSTCINSINSFEAFMKVKI